jgi:hypothetical protein
MILFKRHSCEGSLSQAIPVELYIFFLQDGFQDKIRSRHLLAREFPK